MAEPAPPLLSAEELEAAKRDLQSASAAVENLPPGLVKQRVIAALKQVDGEIQSQLWRHLRSGSNTSGNTTTGGGQRSVEVEATVPMAESAAAASGGGEGAEEMVGVSSNANSDSPTGKVVGLAGRARVTAKSALHAAALALHCLLVTEGFVCTGQDDKAGAVKGFAPPVRDVPGEKLVPDRWDADQSVVSFRYRRPDSPGKVFLFKAACTGGGGGEGPAQFFLGERGGEIMSADVDLEPLDRCRPMFLEAHDFLEHLFSVFRREALSRVVPPKPTNTREAPSQQPAAGDSASPAPFPSRTQPRPSRNPDPTPPGTVEDDPLRVGPPRFAGPPGVGPTPFLPGRGGDFGGDLFPSGGEGGGGLPGPGGLLGPGHPMFGGGDGAGYMEPRFDPFGPPLPGQPWGPGVPGRGAGRGGGAQGGPRGPPGGPDNDHLPPPGGSGNMFF